MDSTLTDRLEKLETHVAHLERQFDELNGVVIGQGRELTRLRQVMQRVSASVEGIELERIKATSAKPPHSVV